MRDLLLTGSLLWIVLVAWRKPWIGILGWTWVSIMNPHALSWNLANMPVAAAVGGSTLIGLFIGQGKKNIFFCRENVVLILFMIWMTLGLPTSFIYAESFVLWSRVMKIDLMILVALILLHSKRHIMLLVWILVFSIGFFGVKGGVFTLATGGNYRVWGPENTYIGGNNEVALAIVMTIPLMWYLQQQLQAKWAKRLMIVCMVLMAASALGSHSRGALLAIGSMAFVLWWRGKNKFGMAVGMLLVGAALLSAMPEEWWARMHTIKSYDEDTSAMGRINAWWMAWNVAKANFFGGGFMIWTGDIFAIYAPDPLDSHAAHSIYFMVLGEQGFIGLFLFLLLFGFVWATSGWLRKHAAKQPETQWLSDLGGMLQVSLVGYVVGGAFLSLSYWDFPYNLLVLAVIGRRWLESKAWQTEQAGPLIVLPAFMNSWVKPTRSRAA